MQVSLAVPRRAARRPRLDPRPRLLALVLTRFAAPPRCAGVRARRGAARRGSYRQPADEQQQQREPARPPSRRAAPPRPAPRLASPPTPGTCAHAARLVVQVCGRAAGPRAADRTAGWRTSSSSSQREPARPPSRRAAPRPAPRLAPTPGTRAYAARRLVVQVCGRAAGPRGADRTARRESIAQRKSSPAQRPSGGSGAAAPDMHGGCDTHRSPYAAPEENEKKTMLGGRLLVV